MEKIYIITSCLECPCDSGATCGHFSFDRKYPSIPNYPAPLADWCSLPDNTQKSLHLEKLQDKLHQIKVWIDAYPLTIFPEPDFKKADRVLKKNGMALDSISASNMRHVLSGIKNIIEN